MELDDDRTAATNLHDRTHLVLDPSLERRAPTWPWMLPAVAAVIAVVAGIWWWSNRAESPPAEEPAAAVPAEPAPTGIRALVPPDSALPALDDSDELVAKLAMGLSNHPQLQAWLGVGSFVRRTVVVVDNIAEGVSPRSHLDFLAPREAFATTTTPAGLVASPETYARWDTLTAVVSSIDAAQAARLYARLAPLFGEAWRDLGYPSGGFDRRLLAALDRLLAVPVPEQPPLLIAKITSYEYADPQLESLGAPEKHLLRLGPTNAKLIQGKLRELRRALAGS